MTDEGKFVTMYLLTQELGDEIKRVTKKFGN